MRSRAGVLSFFKVGGIVFMVLGAAVFLLGSPLGGEAGLGVSITAGVFAFIGLIWFLVGSAVGGYYQRTAANQAADRLLFDTGQRATAVIERVEPSATTINDMPVVSVTVRVTPKYGSPFTHTENIVTPASAIPVPGHLVDVAYDPQDQSRFAFETTPGFMGLPGVILKTRPAGTPAAPEAVAAGGSDEQLDRLERLAKLHQAGVLTDSEFAEQKARVLYDERS